MNIAHEDLKGFTKEAVDNYWNKVPTSRLRLKFGGSISVGSAFSSEGICVGNSAKTGNCEVNTNLKVASGIIIACNDNSTDFSRSGILGVSLPNNIINKSIYGSIILLNNRLISSDNQFKHLNNNEIVSVIAHEIGHAIGLGHSPVKNALMYYSTVPVRNDLGMDDINGVTYLYPVREKFLGIIGCGTIDINNNSSRGSLTFIVLFLLGFILTQKLFQKKLN